MDSSSSKDMALGAMEYMIYHVFLPPKLPQEDDFNQQYEMILLETISDALQKFEAVTGGGIKGIIDMMGSLRNMLDESGAISEWKLENALRELSEKGMFSLLYISRRVFLISRRWSYPTSHQSPKCWRYHQQDQR
jgi:hypothetical protein